MYAIARWFGVAASQLKSIVTNGTFAVNFFKLSKDTAATAWSNAAKVTLALVEAR